MKKNFLIAFSFTCSLLTANAQFSLQASAGIEFYQITDVTVKDSNNNTKALPAGQLDIAYVIFKRLEPAASLNFSGIQHGSANFGARLCYIIGDIEDEAALLFMPLTGYAYNYKTSDKTEFTLGDNYFEWLCGLKIQKGVVFGQVNYFSARQANKFQIMIGLKFK